MEKSVGKISRGKYGHKYPIYYYYIVNNKKMKECLLIV